MYLSCTFIRSDMCVSVSHQVWKTQSEVCNRWWNPPLDTIVSVSHLSWILMWAWLITSQEPLQTSAIISYCLSREKQGCSFTLLMNSCSLSLLPLVLMWPITVQNKSSRLYHIKSLFISMTRDGVCDVATQWCHELWKFSNIYNQYN